MLHVHTALELTNIASYSSTRLSGAGGYAKMAGGRSCSSLVSPESSVGGQSDQQYTWHGSAAGPSELYDDHSTAGRAVYPTGTSSHQQGTSDDHPQPRRELPDLDSSQPGPIEIDTSLLYTPQSGASSADVSQSGTTLPALAVALPCSCEHPCECHTSPQLLVTVCCTLQGTVHMWAGCGTPEARLPCTHEHA